MHYICDYCFQTINSQEAGGAKRATVRCSGCNALMHADCPKGACPKCGGTALVKGPNVVSTLRPDRRLPVTLLAKESPQEVQKPKRAAKVAKPKVVHKPLTVGGQVILAFTWIYLAILLLGVPLLVDWLWSHASSLTFTISMLVSPWACLFVTWVWLRQKRWLSFLALSAATTLVLLIVASISHRDPTLDNRVIVTCTSALLLAILVFVRRSGIKVLNKAVDHVEYTRLPFKLSFALVGCLGIVCSVVVVWLAACQLDKFYALPIRPLEPPDKYNLLTMLVHATGLAVTIFGMTYYMLSGAAGWRVVVALLVALGLFGFYSQKVKIGGTEFALDELLNSFEEPSAADLQPDEASPTDASHAYDPLSPAAVRLYTATPDSTAYAPEVFEFLASELRILHYDWYRTAWVLMFLLLPLRLLGYSLGKL